MEFTLPDATRSNTESNSGGARRAAPSVSENVETVRSRLSAVSEHANAVASQESSGGGLSAASPDAIFVELQTLRKKYDAVVEYTVHLTAERDAIVSQLDTASRELAKEKSRKRADAAGGAGAKGDKGGADKKVAEKGFSLFVVLFVALLCFLLGKYMS